MQIHVAHLPFCFFWEEKQNSCSFKTISSLRKRKLSDNKETNPKTFGQKLISSTFELFKKMTQKPLFEIFFLHFLSLLFQNIDLKASLQMLIIDEADLVFSYGYEHDLKSLLR